MAGVELDISVLLFFSIHSEKTTIIIINDMNVLEMCMGAYFNICISND